ncbi:NHL repeat-containing protein [Aporhodopirellula aestuarii]|uniref:Uncharacterized protein n=1 Tax=Aporhodopirellula aestuarii TaxID=2950107 RepID=A0ABT0U0V4_9BACT|nr:hypothetical protein [Aporhodopirellula aestuarii]MCM2370472.1 hypothetical protein [Aporhodopirellula aestuarii]
MKWIVGSALIVALLCASSAWMIQSRIASAASDHEPFVFRSFAVADDELVVHPADYSSRSNEYRLHVDPSNKDGSGEADYRMQRGVEVIWSVRLPMTLVDVTITDQGEIIGYSYSNGFEGMGPEEGDGDFRVVILNADGTPRLNESTVRRGSRFLHEAPNPKCLAMIVDQDNDRVIFRVEDPDVNRRAEKWWIYRISSGEKLQEVSPREKMLDSEHTRFLISAKPIAGTPLILLHWWRHEYPAPKTEDDSISGAKFTVVDEDAEVVWQIEYPRDYEGGGDETLADRLRDLIFENSAILESKDARQFELFVAADQQAVTYETQLKAGRWEVSRKNRRPMTLAEAFPRNRNVANPMPAPAFIMQPLERLDPIELQTNESAPAISRVFDFTVDEQNRIGWMREDENGQSVFVLVDEHGKNHLEIPVATEPTTAPDREFTWSSCVWISGERFVVTRSEYGSESKSEAWWVDIADRKAAPIEAFDCSFVEQLRAFSDRGFVILERTHYSSTITDALVGFDADGKRSWQVESHTGQDERALFSPDGIAVTTNDEVIVIDNVRHQLQWFDRQGKYLRQVNLDDAWGREANYPTDVLAFADGRILVHDFGGTPPYVVMDNDGSVISDLHPKFADDRKINDYDVVIAPNQDIWMSDHTAIYRLDKTGFVDRVLGPNPQDNPLTELSGSTVDRDGRIHVVDGRTASTHVFDASGRFLQTRVVPSEYYHGEIHFPCISVNDENESALCVETGRAATALIRFDEDGRPLNPVKLPRHSRQVRYQPGTNNQVEMLFDEVQIIGSDHQVRRIIRRRPDGRWFDYLDELAIASDGSFAVLCEGIVSIYDPDGEPLGMVPLPTAVRGYITIALSTTHVAAIGDGCFVVLDRQAKTIQRGELDAHIKDAQCHFLRDGSEILVVPRHGKSLPRYRISK